LSVLIHAKAKEAVGEYNWGAWFGAASGSNKKPGSGGGGTAKKLLKLAFVAPHTPHLKS
jgi:hypothetical protein